MSRLFFFCCALISLIVLGCGGPGVAAPSLSGKEAEMHETGAASLLAGSKAYALKWADTEAAAELRQQLPLAKTFTELNGNEKYYKLPKHLTAADEDVREIHKGESCCLTASMSWCSIRIFRRLTATRAWVTSKQPMIWTLLWGQVMYS